MAPMKASDPMTGSFFAISTPARVLTHVQYLDVYRIVYQSPRRILISNLHSPITYSGMHPMTESFSSKISSCGQAKRKHTLPNRYHFARLAAILNGFVHLLCCGSSRRMSQSRLIHWELGEIHLHPSTTMFLDVLPMLGKISARLKRRLAWPISTEFEWHVIVKTRKKKKRKKKVS